MTSDERYKALALELGRIVIGFAQIEGVFRHLAWNLIQSDQFTGQVITAELSFKSLLSLISSLIKLKLKGQEIEAEIDQRIKRANQLEELRNTYMHSRWGVYENIEETLRFKQVAKQKMGLRTTHMIKDHTAEVRQAADEMYQLYDEILETIRKLPADMNGMDRQRYTVS